MDFFDYPPINFDPEESISWGKIINENIFQPFLPKNRRILQHFLKMFKQEEALIKQTVTRSALLGTGLDLDFQTRRVSHRLTGDPITADRIGKFLIEMSAKLEKKLPILTKKNSKAKKFELRAMKNCQIRAGKRRYLENEEEIKDLVNHKLYDLNLSQPEIKENPDFFHLFDTELTDFGSMDMSPLMGGKRNNELPSIKVLNPLSIVLGQGVRRDSQSRQSDRVKVKDGENPKKMFRRRSCCCSDCGEMSGFEKLTLNLMLNTGERPDSPVPESATKVKLDSITALNGKDK